jgi:hypothetical protein
VLVEGSTWLIEESTVEELVVRVSLTPVWGTVVTAPADGGSHLPAPDQIAAPTTIVVLDLPDLGIGRHDVPTLQIAACQVGTGWSPIPIEVTSSAGIQTIASATSEAVIGTALNSLDNGTSVDVELSDPEHWLESRDDAALMNGANLAALGNELIQFASAVPIGANRFRLDGLLRGCRGTEWAMSSHAAGEAFVLIAAGALQEVALPPLAIGTSVSIRPRGLADDQAQPVQRILTGEAMRPPSPVDLQAIAEADGSLSVQWVRRSRLGWMWPTGSELPLGENAEKYRIALQGSAGTLTYESFEPRITIPAADLTGFAGVTTVSVVQVGDFAESRPAQVSVTI